MSVTRSLVLAAALAIVSAPAFAWGSFNETQPAIENSMRVLAYDGPNYCPAGYQPVVLNGVICCGSHPGQSYEAMMSHPMPTHRHTYSHTHVKTHTHTKAHSH